MLVSFGGRAVLKESIHWNKVFKIRINNKLFFQSIVRLFKSLTEFSCEEVLILNINPVTSSIELKGLDLHTGSFTLRQIKAATNNFAPDNKIGEGGFGPVYKVYYV